MRRFSVKTWCLLGIFAIGGLGGLSHFLFAWSGQLPAIGIFAPVNESVWEHLKMGFWGMIVFSVFEFLSLRERVSNYFAAKLVGLIAMEVTLMIVFYGYTAILGRNLLWFDIASFVVGILVCQGLVYRIFRAGPWPGKIDAAGLVGLLLIAACFSIFTFHPPRLEIFRDSQTGSFGIPTQK